MGKPHSLLCTTRMPGDMDMTCDIVVNAQTSFPTLQVFTNAFGIATQIYGAFKGMFRGVVVTCDSFRAGSSASSQPCAFAAEPRLL